MGNCLTELSVSEVLKKHGKVAGKLIVDEFMQLFKIKKALAPVTKNYIQRKHLWNKIRSSMFLKGKVDGEGTFQKLKTKLVADGSFHDRKCYEEFNSPTATLEAIFIELQSAAKLKIKWAKTDICGSYLNAYFDDDDVIKMVIEKRYQRS